MDIITAKTDAVKFLLQTQRSNGAFEGLASPNPNRFTNAHSQPTIFFSALMLAALSNVENSKVICSKLARYLLRHRSQEWSWNYWERDHISSAAQRYPDDLDDTACSLGALMSYDKTIVDGAVMGHIAQLLVATEVEPGGPYNTWLVDTTTNKVWCDVDIASNANIGWMLNLLDVQLPALTKYFDQAIKHNNLLSSYYCGTAPVLYFISRWYHGTQCALLKRTVKKALHEASDSALERALLICCGTRLGLSKTALAQHVSWLLSQQQAGSWPAAAFYMEPFEHGHAYYAGSKQLTTAFVIEALTRYEQLGHGTSKTQKPANNIVRLPKAVYEDVNAISTLPLRSRYLRSVHEYMHERSSSQIATMATITLDACGQHLPQHTVSDLNLASLNGWIAYSIYDDVLDDEAHPDMIGVANYAARLTVHHFNRALHEHDEFSDYVRSVLTIMDGANTWEVIEARATITDKGLLVSTLPDYGTTLDYLWQRSWGHSLAATGVLLALGHQLTSPEQQALQTFFQHFLIARQLNDDAHDWEDDLKAGHLSYVVCSLLKATELMNSEVLDVSLLLPKLQVSFWQTTISAIDTLIQEHIVKAKEALDRCTAIKDKHAYTNWLAALSRASRTALSERNEARKFMASYQSKVLS